jgi:flagellar assembly factor FliW
MKITTEKFGEISINDDLVFNFIEPIIGYDNLKRYVLIEHSENSAFKWLQSLEDPNLAFPVTSPAFFDIDYQFEIPTEKAESIDLNSVDSLISLNIVTIPSGNPRKATINLVAPIIINAANKQGLQIVLPNSNYLVKTPLFNE